MSHSSPDSWYGTTILTVRKGGKVVIAGDGQVTLGQTIIKGNAKKVRSVGNGNVIAGGVQAALANGVSEEVFDRVVNPLALTRGGLADLPAKPEEEVK